MGAYQSCVPCLDQDEHSFGENGQSIPVNPRESTQDHIPKIKVDLSVRKPTPSGGASGNGSAAAPPRAAGPAPRVATGGIGAAVAGGVGGGGGIAPGTPSFRQANATPLRQKIEFEKKYDLRELIGRGSTSVCHRCVERSTGVEWACKVINKRKVSSNYNGLLEQFQNEIEVLMMLQQTYQHPHIIHLQDVFITDNEIYMIMEFMKGGELFDYVVGKGTLSEEEASGMIRKIMSAVEYMHRQGIVHRDLKPENLLLTEKGPRREVKIIDFGLSKLLGAEVETTQSFLGTRGYLAPEMLKRQAYTKGVDMWALGVIAFILVCGCLPFDDDATKISDETIKFKFVLRFPGWAQNLSAPAKDLLGKLLNIDPMARISAAQALEHPWLLEGSREATKKTLLASPKHIRNVPRTPKQGVQGPPGAHNQVDAALRASERSGGGGGGGDGRGGSTGIGAAVGVKQRRPSF